MVRRVSFILLPAVALIVTLLGESVIARQEEEQGPLPGMSAETLGRSPVAGEGDDLVLLRVTLEPSASTPAGHGPRAAVILLEAGRVGVVLEAGAADLTLSGREGTIPLAPGAETNLAPGDAVSHDDGARLAWHNRGDAEATMLYAVVAAPDESFFIAPASQESSGSFSVETFACPEGMSIATLEMDACEPAAESLVQWSLASDQFAAPLGSAEAAVTGATTTWDNLPAGTYFVELTAESFTPGYGDYFIPSSNQVTRQDERMTRIYYNSVNSTGSINAYVFAASPSTGG